MSKSQKEETSKVTYAAPIVDEKSIMKQGVDLSTAVHAIAVKDQDSYNLAAQERGKVLKAYFHLRRLPLMLLSRNFEKKKKNSSVRGCYSQIICLKTLTEK